MKKLFLLPSRKLSVTIPIVLLVGFITGLFVETTPLKKHILLVTVLMIYPTMIGFKLKEIANFSHGKLILTAMGINFIVIPAVAYLLGTTFLLADPQLFAGLAIAALLPTANMTIAYTMMAKGNVAAAIKLTVTGLILGSLLAPWYLLVMVGQYIHIDILATLKTILMVIMLPLVLGITTYSLLLRKMTEEEFRKSVKPFLPAASAWGMVYIIFTSISMNAQRIIDSMNIFVVAFMVQILFYAINYLISISVGRLFFNQSDAYALVLGTSLRNLSTAIGLAVSSFGANAALMVSLAFLIQGQAAAMFISLNTKYHFLSSVHQLKAK
ncbi:bile acid:sodium symporter [Peptococcaceae bacterium 1198_IL3148]